MITIRNEKDFSPEAKNQLENAKSKAKYAFEAIEHYANSMKIQKMFLNEIRNLSADINLIREENTKLRELIKNQGLELESNVIDLSEAKANKDQQGISHKNEVDDSEEKLPETTTADIKNENEEPVNNFGNGEQAYSCYVNQH